MTSTSRTLTWQDLTKVLIPFAIVIFGAVVAAAVGYSTRIGDLEQKVAVAEDRYTATLRSLAVVEQTLREMQIEQGAMAKDLARLSGREN